MRSLPTEKVSATQLEVAVRQLNAAIRLFFAEDDTFAIYSLVRNAEEIISRILAEKGEKSLWIGMLDDHIKPEYRETVRKKADDPRNQLKHSIKKENEEVCLPVALNEQFLHICVNALQLHWPAHFRNSTECIVFLGWARTHYPEVFLTKVEGFTDDKELTKRQFYEKHKEVALELQRMNGLC